jgi:hypothetical protein
MSKKEVYDLEPDNSGVPKNFIIRCFGCKWSRLSSGVDVDIADLNEIDAGCTTCGKFRKFKCVKCGMAALMKRVKGNS